MTLRSVAGSLALLLAPCLVLTAVSRPAGAGECHCPTTVFCRPKEPRIKYKNVCPKPICPACEMENYGFYPTCWHPWPFPPNYAHCEGPAIAPPPGAALPPGPLPMPHEALPVPKGL